MTPEHHKNIRLTKLKAIEFDASTISRSDLDIENKERSNLLPWKGQFSPQLVESLLQSYGAKGNLVLDPFMGSGTVLYECARAGMDAVGVELNPAAVNMAQIYLLGTMPLRDRRRHVRNVEKRIGAIIHDLPPLFRHDESFADPDSFDLFRQLLGCLTSRLGAPARLILETYLVLVGPGEKPLTRVRAENVWQRLADLILKLPPAGRLRVFSGDCRNIPLEENAVDLVVTSPPYINVFNYHQQKRTPVEAMGWDILSVARSEIGSNRKHRGNRYLTVIQYCLDMAGVFTELHRVCKPGARLIFVVGRESNVRKTSFYNSEIIASIARQTLGFTVTGRHERSFKNRFGQMIKEDLLLLKNPEVTLTDGIDLQRIAGKVLTDARRRAPAESQDDLNRAIAAIADVLPSPVHPSAPVHAGL